MGYFRANLGVTVTMREFYSVLPIIFLVSTIVFPVGMITSGLYGPKLVMALGSLIVVTATLIASLTTNPWIFYLVFSVGFGLGKGLTYPASFKAGWLVLPGRKGLVSGIVVSGFGVGSCIYGLVAG